jgi:hypothetical protein
MLQNYQPRRNFRSFRTWCRVRQSEKASDGGNGRKWTTVRLSSGTSANILDFGIPQKHVVTDMAAQETGRKAGDGEVQTCEVQIY